MNLNLNSLLVWRPVSRIRRNHALEHATLNVLSKKHPALRLAGYSDTQGFWMVGKVSTDDLREAVDEALRRLQNGEANLAIHNYCGTNFVVSGMAAGTAAMLAMLGSGQSMRDKFDRWPLVVTFSTLALIFSQPLGPKAQRKFTTQPQVGELQVSGIVCMERNKVQLHHVITKH